MIKFYAKRKWFFLCSALLFTIGLLFIFMNGVTLDIQFKGGAILKYTYSGELDLPTLSEKVNAAFERTVNIQLTHDMSTDTQKVVFSFAGNNSISTEDQQALEQLLTTQFKDHQFTLSESNNVAPFIGKRFFMNGLLAIGLSSILIILYVWVRFRKISGLSAGVMALVALLHDCLMVFFTFVIFGIPINEGFVAVILTVLGYSINDTIIIYDRIRENARKETFTHVEDLVDTSITQSMTRSINTTCTTVLSIIIMLVASYLYGIRSMFVFALPMLVGMLSGCYSTICIAGPLWVMWQKHKLSKKQ